MTRRTDGLGDVGRRLGRTHIHRRDHPRTDHLHRAEIGRIAQVDIGLVPVALLTDLDNYKVITDYCIGANGKVDSVKLYSAVDLNSIKTITLDYQSRSSIKLTKILAKEFWKIRPEYIDGKPGFESTVSESNAVVVIGDRTFELNGKFKYEWDLSEEWQKFTGLPFVFAAWVINSSNVPAEFIGEFNDVLKHGLDNIRESIKADNSGEKNFDPLDYLTKKIDYNLGNDKREAMNLFLAKIKALN